MSTLKVTTITDTANANLSTVESLYKGRAKAWVIFNASSGTPVITTSHNVDSITDHAVGLFTINWTAGALPDAKYAVVFGCSISETVTTTRSGQTLGIDLTTVVKTDTALRIISKSGANNGAGSADQDPTYACVVVFDV